MLHSSLSRVAQGAGEFEHQASLGQMVTTVDAQLLNAVVMVLTLGVVAGLAVLLVTRASPCVEASRSRIRGHSQKLRSED
jgi:hypothetical protein